jgi:hypothetical protein
MHPYARRGSIWKRYFSTTNMRFSSTLVPLICVLFVWKGGVAPSGMLWRLRSPRLCRCVKEDFSILQACEWYKDLIHLLTHADVCWRMLAGWNGEILFWKACEWYKDLIHLLRFHTEDLIADSSDTEKTEVVWKGAVLWKGALLRGGKQHFILWSVGCLNLLYRLWYHVM